MLRTFASFQVVCSLRSETPTYLLTCGTSQFGFVQENGKAHIFVDWTYSPDICA